MIGDSVSANVQIAKEDVSGTGKCPDGTTIVTDNFRPLHDGIVGCLSAFGIASLLGGRAILLLPRFGAKDRLQGLGFPPLPSARHPINSKLDSALEPDTKYRVKFFGDNSTTTDPFSDNADLSKKHGIKTAKGVVAEYDASAEKRAAHFLVYYRKENLYC